MRSVFRAGVSQYTGAPLKTQRFSDVKDTHRSAAISGRFFSFEDGMRQTDAYRLAGLLASRYQAATINIRCGARRELVTFADVHNIGRNSGWNLQHCVPKFPRGEWIAIDLETTRHMDNRHRIRRNSVVHRCARKPEGAHAGTRNSYPVRPLSSSSPPLNATLFAGAIPLSKSSFVACAFFDRCAIPIPRRTCGALLN
jgi:hypothetical protein